MPARTRKIAFQLAVTNKRLPKDGARMGETPKIRIIKDMIFGRSFSSKVSRITAFGATIPTLPPKA